VEFLPPSSSRAFWNLSPPLAFPWTGSQLPEGPDWTVSHTLMKPPWLDQAQTSLMACFFFLFFLVFFKSLGVIREASLVGPCIPDCIC
jgi:hypothetical protein